MLQSRCPVRVVCAAALLVTGTNALGQPACRLQNLGTFGGVLQSDAFAVSDDGTTVVGWATRPDEVLYAFRWISGQMLDLGSLGGEGSQAVAVSADGRVIVGTASNDDNYSRAFRWTQADGMIELGTLPAFESSGADAVSGDGETIVGSTFNLGSDDTHSFRWTASEGMQDLGTFGGLSAYAAGVSRDGRVVVGGSTNAEGAYRAFRWTPPDGTGGGLLDLGTLGGRYALGIAVSADGHVVVGVSENASGFLRVFRWSTSDGIMRDIGPAGATATGYQFGLTSDGGVIVGRTNVANRFEAFRWTAHEGMRALGTLGGSTSSAHAVSEDGNVVVGWAMIAGDLQHAFRWTASDGVMRDLGHLGSDTSVAVGLSRDADVVIGTSFNRDFWPRAFRWIPALCDCVADLDDGTNTGTPDGGVTIEDLLYFLDQYAQGTTRADLDDGTGTGTQDGGVTIDDLLYFLVRYYAGC